MKKYNWQIVPVDILNDNVVYNGTMIEFDYDPINGRKKDWFTFILPGNNTAKGKYINDAFKWWQLYQPYFKDGWTAPKMKFEFGTAKFQIPNKKLNVLRFIKNIQKLPAEHFVDKTWYDTLTGMPRMLYTPMIKEAA